MKVLVTTRHVVAGSMSEGTCTVKFANLLASPFFPAELADLVSRDGPLLVLAPTASTPADIVGTDHPGFAAAEAALDRALAAPPSTRRP